jgi:hypothetical protein
VGRDVDVNLFDTALANLNYSGGGSERWDAQGREPRGAHPSLTPSALPDADGWIFIVRNSEVLAGAVRSGGRNCRTIRASPASGRGWRTVRN